MSCSKFYSNFNCSKKVTAQTENRAYCMATHLLTDATIRNAKQAEKDKRLSDGGGLYQLIKPNGAKR